MLVGIWDVPDTPVGWTAQGDPDWSQLVECPSRVCSEFLRAESLDDHLRLTHGIMRPDERAHIVAQVLGLADDPVEVSDEY